ncbi:serine hydrolase domain-containing protein [Phenylobacterium sp.]|uniref:serine hydrolase domain-containing protein n=1 Tax=Phenylobacterium sp. TaxID=1871053 RepID=UPI0025D30CB2|nr:serine hydrolase domain-containing protein [Phenylobacterium sp.]
MVRWMRAPLLGMTLTLAASATAQAAVDPARLDRLFTAFAKDGPGLSVAVSQGGKTTYSRAFGAADIEHGDPATPQTRFHAASISKEFTALAIAMLAAEGKVDLDADIRRYLPYVPDFGATITVLDLLHHTSGLRDQWSLFTLSGNDGQGMRRQGVVLEMVRRQTALNFAPGTQFSYSNTGYTLLAEIVKATSGRTLREFTTERIFQPLGMERTFFYDNARELVPGRASSYAPGQGGAPELARLNFETVGATSLLTTAEDLAIWGRELMNPKILDPKIIARMKVPGRLKDDTPINYGLGLLIGEDAGHRSIGHGGSDAGFRSAFLTFPDDDTVVALVASGQAPANDLAVGAADLALNSRTSVARPIVTPAPAVLTALAGDYVNDWRTGMRLELRDGALVRHAFDAPEAKAVFRANDRFDFGAAGTSYRVIYGPNRQVAGLEETTRWGGHGLVHRRATIEAPSPTELAALAGSYRSEELDLTYELRVRDGRLAMNSLRHPDPVVFLPSAKDMFDSSFARLKVRRDPSGRPVAILLDASGGRILNLALARLED